MAAFVLPLIGAGASMLGNMAGNNAEAEASIEGANRYADAQRGQLALNKRIGDDQRLRQQPYYDFGVNALSRIGQGQQSPFFAQQQRMGNDNMRQQVVGRSGPTNPIMQRFNQDMRVADQGMGEQMDWDRVKIGFGEAGSAGDWINSLGSTRANLNNSLAQMLAQGRMGANMSRQNMGVEAVNTLSSYPEYMLARR